MTSTHELQVLSHSNLSCNPVFPLTFCGCPLRSQRCFPNHLLRALRRLRPAAQTPGFIPGGWHRVAKQRDQQEVLHCSGLSCSWEGSRQARPPQQDGKCQVRPGKGRGDPWSRHASGNPRGKTVRVSLSKHLDVAACFLRHFQTTFLCSKQLPPLSMSAFPSSFNSLKEPGIFNSNN